MKFIPHKKNQTLVKHISMCSPTSNILVLILMMISATVHAQDWSQAIDLTKQSVITIRTDATRAFDGEWNASSQATGFVVDAERGIILTNRHVVTQGPVVAEGVFINGEEVELTPVYRDPVHDFGFFSFDPDQIRFFKPKALKLDPDSAKVGTEVRIIGNDAGEQLSILTGTLAKLDRDAPSYGRRSYNDFNTFYIQSASNTSGGSSGSPVIDIRGHAVALNAAGRSDAASSFFLPLDRIVPALKAVQQKQPVPRGTWQTSFKFRRFDELRRLGLSLEQEKTARQSDQSIQGLLVVERIIPGSPAAELMRVGDILFDIEDQLINGFVPLAQSLDGQVGETMKLTLIRGGQLIQGELVSSDLHAITPNNLVSIGNASLHTLSYQQARNLNRPLAGMFVASPGMMLSSAGLSKGDIILEIDGKTVNSTEALLSTMKHWHQGQELSLRYIRPNNPRQAKFTVVRAERQWHSDEFCSRPQLQDWQCEFLPPALPAKPQPAKTVNLPRVTQKPLNKIVPSLVRIKFEMPFGMTGISRTRHNGLGLIIDTEQGLVLTDRNTIPVSLGQARITFGGALSVPARVVGIHPTHNLALLSYAPELIGQTEVKSVRLAKKRANAGDTVWMASMDASYQLLTHKTQIKRRDALYTPLSPSLGFREINLDALDLINDADISRGVLINQRAEVVALWTHELINSARSGQLFNYAIPSELIRVALDELKEPQQHFPLTAEFSTISPVQARERGVPDDWLERYQPKTNGISQLLTVERLMNNGSSSLPFENGDILLSINQQFPQNFLELEQAANRETLKLLVWRDRQTVQFEMKSQARQVQDIDQLVSWGGAIFHAPHPAARMLGVNPEGAYIAFYSFGSPASRYGLSALQSVIEINENKIHNMADFIEQISMIKDREAARLRLRTWDGREQLITLKADLRYWPGHIWRLKNHQWHRTGLIQ